MINKIKLKTVIIRKCDDIIEKRMCRRYQGVKNSIK